jgi:nucleotidyltransferase/DNA polymerase involved in DNA repair
LEVRRRAILRVSTRRALTLMQPLPLDGAYPDLTVPVVDCGPPRALAEEIRTEPGPTASASVSYNRCLAGLASHHHKPDWLVDGAIFVEHHPGPVVLNRKGA